MAGSHFFAQPNVWLAALYLHCLMYGWWPQADTSRWFCLLHCLWEGTKLFCRWFCITGKEGKKTCMHVKYFCLFVLNSMPLPPVPDLQTFKPFKVPWLPPYLLLGVLNTCHPTSLQLSITRKPRGSRYHSRYFSWTGRYQRSREWSSEVGRQKVCQLNPRSDRLIRHGRIRWRSLTSALISCLMTSSQAWLWTQAACWVQDAMSFVE